MAMRRGVAMPFDVWLPVLFAPTVAAATTLTTTRTGAATSTITTLASASLGFALSTAAVAVAVVSSGCTCAEKAADVDGPLHQLRQEGSSRIATI